MALRAGSYNAAKPAWRGVARWDGFPWYVCTHTNHRSPSEAAQCAKNALSSLKTRNHQDPNDSMPPGWIVYRPREE